MSKTTKASLQQNPILQMRKAVLVGHKFMLCAIPREIGTSIEEAECCKDHGPSDQNLQLTNAGMKVALEEKDYHCFNMAFRSCICDNVYRYCYRFQI